MTRTVTKALAAVMLTTAIGAAAGQAGATPAGITPQPADTAAIDTATTTGSGALGTTGSTVGPITQAFSQLLGTVLGLPAGGCPLSAVDAYMGPCPEPNEIVGSVLVSPSYALGI